MVFITEAELLELKPLYDEGKDTIRTYKNSPTLQLRRRNTVTEAFQDVYQPFRPVKIELAERVEQISGTNAGAVTIVQGGSFQYDGSFTIQRDDRFVLDGVPCVVTLVHPEANIFGYRTVEFEFLGGR